MSDHLWNDDIAYAFSTHKVIMELFGLWPLQKRTLSAITQWSLITILQLTPLIFMCLEFIGHRRDADASIETILFMTCTISCAMKNFCIIINRKKLARNLNVALHDWLSAKDDKESYQIMKKYAFQSRLLTSVILYLANTCAFLYVISVVFMNLRQTVLQNMDKSDVNVNTTNWMFLIPSGELGGMISSRYYIILIILQSFQLFVISVSQCIADSFYTNITLHLTGQLEVLEKRFKAFGSKQDTEINYRKQLADLVNKHCELTELNQNLEDTFNIIILYQLGIVTLLLALLGLRLLFSLKDNNYVLLMKTVLAWNFLFMESLMYSFCGDFIQRGSEDIFHALFTTSWFTLPAALMKDLHFVMMRSSYPFRLTGGKFFYSNRETILNVLKTSLSYVSVLRLALLD